MFTPSASFTIFDGNLDAEFITPDMPPHIERVRADMIIVENFMVANIAQKAAFQRRPYGVSQR